MSGDAAPPPTPVPAPVPAPVPTPGPAAAPNAAPPAPPPRARARFGGRLLRSFGAYLAGLVREGTSELPGASSVPEVTSETIVGGLYEVLYSRVVRGETDELPQLVPDLVQAVVLPYLGLEGAQAVRARVLRDRAS